MPVCAYTRVPVPVLRSVLAKEYAREDRVCVLALRSVFAKECGRVGEWKS